MTPGFYWFRKPGEQWKLVEVAQLAYQRKPRVWVVQVNHGTKWGGTRTPEVGTPLRKMRGEFQGPINPPTTPEPVK